MLWVHATLVIASLAAYRRFERPLTRPEQERVLPENGDRRALFGTPAEVIPPRPRRVRLLPRRRVRRAAPIDVTAAAREIASVILRAPLPAPMRMLAPAHRLATAALLPERLRDDYEPALDAAPPRALPQTGLGALKLGSWPILSSRRPPATLSPATA